MRLPVVLTWQGKVYERFSMWSQLMDSRQLHHKCGLPSHGAKLTKCSGGNMSASYDTRSKGCTQIHAAKTRGPLLTPVFNIRSLASKKCTQSEHRKHKRHRSLNCSQSSWYPWWWYPATWSWWWWWWRWWWLSFPLLLGHQVLKINNCLHKI